MLKIKKYTMGVMQTNVYFALNEKHGECVVIDPAANAVKLIDIAENILRTKPAAILLTHGHFDHILAARELAAHFGIRIYAGEKERETLASPDENLSRNFNLDISITEFTPLRDGDTPELAGACFRVLETPGHTPGGVSYFTENEGKPLVFTGDTLFQESFGRTDFPGGSEKQLFDSIRNRLFTLPEETMVYPGHESETMISHEKKYNPVVYLSQLGAGGISI